jgi:uncharacterized SAM-binding protein YcdF (DUF218 family)
MGQRSKKIYWLQWALIIVFFLIMWFGGLAIDVYRYSSASYSLPADAAIVLGAAVWDGQLSPVFEERMKHAIDLYQAGRVKAIILTGGVGKGEQVADSVAAAAYAIQRGVEEEAVFCDTKSRYTYDNLRGAKAIIQEQGFGRVLIVSDPLHMRRAMIMARDLDLDAYPSPTLTSRYVSLQNKAKFLSGEVLYETAYLIGRPFMHKSPNDIAIQPCR